MLNGGEGSLSICLDQPNLFLSWGTKVVLSSKIDSAGKAEDKGNAVESLRFEDEDNGSLLELFPFDRLFTLEYKYISSEI
jgi:hypothetical protein